MAPVAGVMSTYRATTDDKLFRNMHMVCALFCLVVILIATLARGQSLRWRHNEHDSVSNHQPHDCLLNRLFRRSSEKTSKLRVTGLCAGNSPGTGEFSAQMASNAENVSIWWRHHACDGCRASKATLNETGKELEWTDTKWWYIPKSTAGLCMYSMGHTYNVNGSIKHITRTVWKERKK